VSLFCNENAGDGMPLDRIRDVVAKHGHDLVCVVERQTEFERPLEALPDVVVAAEGTARSPLPRACWRTGRFRSGSRC
jgi:hypothetical protein